MGKLRLKSKKRSKPIDTQALQQLLQQAIKLQQAGNLKVAEGRCRDILKQIPDHGDTLQLLAILLQQGGNTTAALHFMQKALQTAPQNPQMLKNLAEIYRAQGDYYKAQTYAQQALSRQPDNVDALVILGAVYNQLRQPDKAIDPFSRALDLGSDDVFVRNELANALSSIGQYNSAVAQYQHALARQPEFDDCRINLADTLLELNACEQAIDHYLQVLKHQPENVSVHNRLGNAYEKQGDVEKAMLSYRAALQINPKFLEAHLNLGKTLLASNPQQARDRFSSVLDMDRDHAEAHYWLGILSQTMGEFEQANNYLKQAIRIKPGFSAAWYRLSLDRSFEPTRQQIEILEQLFSSANDNDSNDDTLISLGFTLGRFLEQRGQYAAAFEYFRQANRLKAARHKFDKAEHDSQVKSVIGTFDAGFFNQRHDWGDTSDLPIFILGMPRSGTTLVEQIVSSHPSIHGAGELEFMQHMMTTLKISSAEAQSHAERIRVLDRSQVALLAGQYIDQIRAIQPAAVRVLDKLPGNYFRLGVICLLFPNARIIHCKRDPMDTCWSCYQQNFEQGLNFTNDLVSMGHAYRGYLRLMAHWQELFSERILDVQYEELLNDPKSICRQIIRHCGMEWNSTVLDYRLHQRPVSTASMWQVRQPLYKSSIGRWKNFEPYLMTLQQALLLPE